MHKKYERPSYSMFNPTITAAGDPIPYDFQKRIEMGDMTIAQFQIEMFKIFFINSDLHIHNIKFVEQDSIPDPNNHLIMNDYQNRTTFKLTKCEFYLQQGLIFFLFPLNSIVEENYFDMNNDCIRFASIFGDYFCSDHDPLSSIHLWKNNYFTGKSSTLKEIVVGFAYTITSLLFEGN